MNIEQAELLSKVAMHIRNVPRCYTGRTYPNTYTGREDDQCCCMLGNALFGGVAEADFVRAHTYGDPPFDIEKDDWLRVLEAEKITSTEAAHERNRFVAGSDYYHAVVSLLTKYDKLHVLRRMEGRLMPVVIKDGEAA